MDDLKQPGYCFFKHIFTTRIKIPFLSFSFIYSFLILALYNQIWWEKNFQDFNIQTANDLLFFVQFFFILTIIHTIILSIFCFKYTTKLICTTLLLINSAASYFINNYGIGIDTDMVKNVFNTNTEEAFELFSWDLILHMILYNIPTILLIFKVDIIYKPFWQEILRRIIYCMLFVLLAVIMVMMNYQKLSIFIRSTKTNMNYLTPRNYLYSGFKIIKYSIKQDNKIMHKIGSDASIIKNDSKLLVITIVGETARKKNFSLFGYERKTNPTLENDDLLIFDNTTSCGTSTEISLPCMFSHLGRNEFIKNNKKYEFLPSLLARLNVNVLWKDNNFGGCKGVCANVDFVDTRYQNIAKFCASGECLDDILLDNLPQIIRQNKNKNNFIILHQNGSHGPRYDKRYPKEFEFFKPTCNLANVSKCSQEQIINAYDNSILYTDHIIHQTIKIVQQEKIPAVVIYMSDHGESLGENKVYLHGFPYFIAPKEQKEIPFLIWMSESLQNERKINKKCIKNRLSYSHDNLFHSVLGLFKIKIPEYVKELDIFHNCIE